MLIFIKENLYACWPFYHSEELLKDLRSGGGIRKGAVIREYNFMVFIIYHIAYFSTMASLMY